MPENSTYPTSAPGVPPGVVPDRARKEVGVRSFSGCEGATDRVRKGDFNVTRQPKTLLAFNQLVAREKYGLTHLTGTGPGKFWWGSD